MASVNKVILVGNLGRDPELRSNPDGFSVANVSLATTSVWTDRNTGDRREETEWHRIVFYNRQAEIVAQYLKKGSSIYVEGRLRTRKYVGRDNIERYTTEIVADNMQMLGGRNTSAGDATMPEEYGASGAGAYGAYSSATRSPDAAGGAGFSSGGSGFASGGNAPRANATKQSSAQPLERATIERSGQTARPAAPEVNEGVSDLDEDIPF